ncbi:MAG: PqqD family protein [Myxococcaceae bacterium]|jgi:hypothetical protein|nr:PqqD family protein [Myxococcaceae bacterium]
MLTLSEHVSCSPQVLSQLLEGETVILDLDAGIYFGLDEVSTAIWELVRRPGGATTEEIRTTMLAEFDVQEDVIDRDLESFLEALKARGLVVMTAAASIAGV